jgi:hypothetical protein
VSSAKRPTSSRRDDNDGRESYRGPLLAAEDSGSLAASQELSTSMEQEWASPPDRFFAEHRDRLLVPHRYGRPDAVSLPLAPPDMEIALDSLLLVLYASQAQHTAVCMRVDGIWRLLGTVFRPI